MNTYYGSITAAEARELTIRNMKKDSDFKALLKALNDKIIEMSLKGINRLVYSGELLECLNPFNRELLEGRYKDLGYMIRFCKDQRTLKIKRITIRW